LALREAAVRLAFQEAAVMVVVMVEVAAGRATMSKQRAASGAKTFQRYCVISFSDI